MCFLKWTINKEKKVKSAYKVSGPSGHSLFQFLYNEATRCILLPIRGLLLVSSFPGPINAPGWKEALLKKEMQCPWPGLEPRPLDQEISALTMRLPPT